MQEPDLAIATKEVEKPSIACSIDIDVAKVVNYALAHSGVPIVPTVRVINTGTEVLRDLELVVLLAPDLGEATSFPIQEIRPGESWEGGPLNIALPHARLREVIEAENGELRYFVRGNSGAEWAKGSRSVRVLAFNEWPGIALAPPGILACFVTPNQPAVQAVLRTARSILVRETGDDSLSGYQTGNPKRVLEQVRSVYAAIQELGISYIGVPASFEEVGQKLRLPDQLLAEKMGNCIDVSLLFAACFEQISFHPILILVKGHAFPAVWLKEETFPEGCVDDAARLRNQVELGNILVFNSSTTITDERPPLEIAADAGRAYLADDENFGLAIDVRASRKGRFLPLPIRLRLRDESVDDDDSPTAVRSGSRYRFEGDLDLELQQKQELERIDSGRASEDNDDPASSSMDPVQRRLRKWREQLLDLSLRNRLLNFRLDRGTIPLEVPNAAEFENGLAGDADYEVLPAPVVFENDRRAEQLVESNVDPKAEHDRLVRDMQANRLHSELSPSTLFGVSKKLARVAKNDLEEGGVNTLYAVVGFLKWFESDSSQVERFAPILLLPIRIEVNPRTERVHLRRADEDALGNVTLVEKMKKDFELDFSFLIDPPTDDSGFDVALVFRKTREAIQRRNRWEVVEDVHVGQFTFAKFLMWSDLRDSEAAILSHPIVNHIAAGGKRAFPDTVSVPDVERFDDEVTPENLPTVVDADSTQLRAVLAALRGRSFVLQGPPGTGKSQTITNLIAAALSCGKTVLFVSEKMAALDVVHRRLKACGLDEYCLELHSNKANKKQVLESLGKALAQPKARVSGNSSSAAQRLDFAGNAAKIEQLRTQLNAYARALHRDRPIGMTFFEASAQVLRLREFPRIQLDLKDDVRFGKADMLERLNAAHELVPRARKVEPVNLHPWRQTQPSSWSAQLESTLRTGFDGARAQLKALGEVRQRLQGALGMEVGTSLHECLEHAKIGAALAGGPFPSSVVGDDSEWNRFQADLVAYRNLLSDDETARGELAKRWNPSLFALGDELEELQERFEKEASKIGLVQAFTLRAAKKSVIDHCRGELPDARRIAKDLAIAVQCGERASQLRRMRDGILMHAAGAEKQLESSTALDTLVGRFRRVRETMLHAPDASRARLVALAASSRADFVKIAEAARDLTQAVDQLREGLSKIESAASGHDMFPEANQADAVSSLRRRIDELSAALPRFRDWASYTQGCVEAVRCGLKPLVEALRSGQLLAEQIDGVVERSLLETWVERVRDTELVLRDFDGDLHSTRVSEFKRADTAHISLSQQHVQLTLNQKRPPMTSAAVSDSSEPGIVMREVKKKTRHLPLRKLFQQIPGLLPKLKPCFLMSPLSIAQYLPPSGRKFDLVIFDEASQIGSHDAIGAIARGNQVVIVGDSKQLPPTSFFSRSAADDASIDDADVNELESVLDEALAARMPEQSLGWHYRSRHEALIQFSNRHYYDSGLHVFPAARGRVEDLGVKWHFVPDGRYEFGGNRDNPVEARTLVEYLVGALRATKPSERTYGVVTFSMAQQNLILDLLDEARKKHPEIEPHFSAELPESVFVKNLENVQGDERDEIYFSICYGPTADGKVRMNFGPLNRTGGERRLNVAVTRARSQLRVFSSMTHHQIDLNRTNAQGARHLREFLRYAQEQGANVIGDNHVRTAQHDSDFEREVAEILESYGYVVDAQVGCGGYRIDLGVRHPVEAGVYVLGVECDGAAYHSGATARDRDRLRQAVLENLGWKLHRIWSTDWWFNRDREIERVRAAVVDAIENPNKKSIPAPAAVASDVAGPPSQDPPLGPESNVHPSGSGLGGDGSVGNAKSEAEQTAAAPLGGASFEVKSSPPSSRVETSDAAPTLQEAQPLASVSPTSVAEPPSTYEGNEGVTSIDGPPLEVYPRYKMPTMSADPESLVDIRYRSQIRDHVLAMTKVEGPVHQDVIAKTITSAFGVRKMSARFRGAVIECVDQLVREGKIRVVDDFVWPVTEDPKTYFRMRGADSDSESRKLEEIAVEEIAVAAAWYLSHAFSITNRELARSTARTFGINRVGKDVEKRIGLAIELIVQRGHARRVDEERIEWVGA